MDTIDQQEKQILLRIYCSALCMRKLLNEYKPSEMSDEEFLTDCMQTIVLVLYVNGTIQDDCSQYCMKRGTQGRSSHTPSSIQHLLKMNGGTMNRAGSPPPPDSAHHPPYGAAREVVDQVAPPRDDADEENKVIRYAQSALKAVLTVATNVADQVHGLASTRVLLFNRSIAGRAIAKYIFRNGDDSELSSRDIVFIFCYVGALLFLVNHIFNLLFGGKKTDMFVYRRDNLFGDARRLGHTVGGLFPNSIQTRLGVDLEARCINPTLSQELVNQMVDSDFTDPIEVFMAMVGYIRSIFTSSGVGLVSDAIDKQMYDMPFCRAWLKLQLSLYRALTQTKYIDMIEEFISLIILKGGKVVLSLGTINLMLSLFDVTMHSSIKALVSGLVKGNLNDFTAKNDHAGFAAKLVPGLSVVRRAVGALGPKRTPKKGGSKRHGRRSKRRGNRLNRRGHKTTHCKKN